MWFTTILHLLDILDERLWLRIRSTCCFETWKKKTLIGDEFLMWSTIISTAFVLIHVYLMRGNFFYDNLLNIIFLFYQMISHILIYRMVLLFHKYQFFYYLKIFWINFDPFWSTLLLLLHLPLCLFLLLSRCILVHLRHLILFPLPLFFSSSNPSTFPPSLLFPLPLFSFSSSNPPPSHPHSSFAW